MAEASCWVRRVSSGTAMIEASAEFFMVETASLPRAGTTERNACGATTRRISRLGTMPRARPAAVWPASTPRMPERKISAKKTASLRASATPPATSGGKVTPARGRTLNTKTSCRISGSRGRG
nr:hypothetical protein [Quadrisphaera sp. INWT6]